MGCTAFGDCYVTCTGNNLTILILSCHQAYQITPHSLNYILQGCPGLPENAQIHLLPLTLIQDTQPMAILDTTELDES